LGVGGISTWALRPIAHGALTRENAGNCSDGAYLTIMRVKLISLTCAVSGIAIVSVSCAYASVNVADNGALRAAKSPESKVETIVAQAWWDAAYNATTAQQQAPTRQARPLVRNENQSYRRYSR
jgi:hypothetical protein